VGLSILPGANMESLYVQTVILDLFSDRPSEVGARLKQRLNRTLMASGFQAFDEQQFGYRKFSDFLTGELGNRLAVEKSAHGGDVTVHLKNAYSLFPKTSAFRVAAANTLGSDPVEAHEAAHPASTTAREQVEPPKVVRGDVWQAFTHLNAKRKRYLDRETGQVVHFLEETHSDQEQLVTQFPDRFVEIPRVDAQTQKQWMHEFLPLSGLSEADMSSLNRLLDEPYSSKLNALFARALGQRQSAWKQYRAQCMGEIIKRWAEASGVTLGILKACRSIDQAPSPVRPPVSAPGTMSALEQAQKLLAMMDDHEIVTIAIPAMLGCVLAKTRF
jgi:hypothetical protein